MKASVAEDSFVTVDSDRSRDQSGITTGDSYYEDEEGEDDEEEVDEEEILFNKRATLKCAVDNNTWEVSGFNVCD